MSASGGVTAVVNEAVGWAEYLVSRTDTVKFKLVAGIYRRLENQDFQTFVLKVLETPVGRSACAHNATRMSARTVYVTTA